MSATRAREAVPGERGSERLSTDRGIQRRAMALTTRRSDCRGKRRARCRGDVVDRARWASKYSPSDRQ